MVIKYLKKIILIDPSPFHLLTALLIIIILILIWLLLGFLLPIIIYLLSLLGSTVITALDLLTFTITNKIKFINPIIAWTILGSLIGLALGFIIGLKRTQQPDQHITEIGLAILLLLLLLLIFANQQYQKIVITEGFNQIIVTERNLPQWDLTEGASIKNGALFQNISNSDQIGWSSWNQKELSDIDFQAQVEKISGDDQEPFGLIARVNKKGYYYLLINGSGDLRMGIKNAQGYLEDWVSLSAITLIKSGDKKRNQLRIICQGNQITGWVNDRLAGSFEDTSYSQGGVGVLSDTGKGSSVAVYFDNILVKEKNH